MSTAELLAERDLALELHALLSDIDPVRWRSEKAGQLKPRLTELWNRLSGQPQHAELVRAEVPAVDAPKSTWLRFKEQLQPAYVELAKRLAAASIHVPSLRPTNHRRSLLHVSSGVFATVVIALLAKPWLIAIAAAWAVFAWTCEVSRRLSPRVNVLLMKAFGPVAHAHESHRVNSATWYATALLLLSLTQSTALCLAGVVVLGIGDPVAGLIGRRFGRIKLMHGRSLEGTLAFVVSATLTTFVVFSLLLPALSMSAALGLALAASVAGAIAELVSLRIDDNFSIPLSAGAGLWAVASVLAISF